MCRRRVDFLVAPPPGDHTRLDGLGRWQEA
uniref:Uncharacterized protein n=1 Tax=Arundo donax TaxID=35708 RepID=A0A0A8ZA76_ARUDO